MPAERMPGNIKAALVGVWFQVLSNGFVGWFLLSEIDSRLDHNQEVEYLGLTRFLSYTSLVVALLLVVCAVLATKRFGWVRTTVLGIEGLTALSVLFGFFTTGTPSVIIGLFLTCAIASAFLGERGRDWFSR